MAPKPLAMLLILVFIPHAFAGELPILSVVNTSTVPSTIYANDLITLNFDVKNISGSGQAADGVKVSLILNENDFSPVKISENIGSLKARESKTVSMRFMAGNNVLPGNYKIPVLLEYLSGSDSILQPESVNFNVSSCKTLQIGNIQLSSPKPHIGDTLEISVPVENTCSTAARNVSVELKPVTNASIEPFIVSSGTLKKIGPIQPGGTGNAEFSLRISDNVAAQTYVFSVGANCDTCSKSSNSFSFLVLGRPELVFSSIEYSVDNAPGGSDKEIMQGSTFTLSVQLDNIGQEKAKATEVLIDFGGKIAGTKKAFLGNIDPDDSGAAIFSLKADYDAVPGEQPGTITVSFIDELGGKSVITETYPLFVNPQPPVGPLVYAFILILIIIALGLVYFIAKFAFRQWAIMKNSR